MFGIKELEDQLNREKRYRSEDDDRLLKLINGLSTKIKALEEYFEIAYQPAVLENKYVKSGTSKKGRRDVSETQ